MKRQIKFRGKIKDKNSLLFNQWIYGYFFKFSSRYVISDNFDIGYEWTKDFCNVDENTVGQFTGLYDKNGVEIYEGDIIDIHQTVCGCNLFEIVWDKTKWNARYAMKMNTSGLYEYSFNELIEANILEKEVEIIGNIYDNPELLESEE